MRFVVRSRCLARVTVAGLLAVSACSGSTSSGKGIERSGASVVSEPTATTSSIVVDGSQRHQTIDGFGASIRLFDDPHLTETFDPATHRSRVVVPPEQQALIQDALYRELGLTRLRPATGEGIQRAPGAPYDFSWKLNDDYMAFASSATTRGARAVFLSPITLEPWMTEADPAAYVEWAFQIIKRWNDAGTPLTYYSIVNEPGNPGSGGWSGEFIRDAIKLLGPRLAEAGMQTKFVVPDDLNPAEAAGRVRTVLADPEARQYVGALAYHLYGAREGIEQIADLGRQHGIPIWMTEYYEADPFAWGDLVHDLLAEQNVSAVDYLWGFFGQWRDRSEALITVQYDPQGSYVGFDRTKHYYVFGQFTRFIPPGSQRIGVTVGGIGVRASAYANGPSTVIVAINNASSAATTRIAVTDRPATRASAVRTTASANWEQLTPGAVEGGAFVATLAPGSVTTFTVT